MRETTDGPASTIAAGLVPGALIAGLMALMAAAALGWIHAGPWRPAVCGLCLVGALAISTLFSFEMKTDGGTVFFLAMPLLLLATVLTLCLMPDMVLVWIS
jgi:hypothetical protein